jgi:hypothetical protein
VKAELEGFAPASTASGGTPARDSIGCRESFAARAFVYIERRHGTRIGASRCNGSDSESVTAIAPRHADGDMTTVALSVPSTDLGRRESVGSTAASACTATATLFTARALHLVDLENLVGGPTAADKTIERVWGAYYGGIPRGTTDQVLVGSSRFFARRTWWMLPAGIQRRVRDGKDGGELAILDEVDLDHLVERFGRLVIASGDGRFAELARAARGRGVHVHQVTGIGTPSRSRLSAASSRSRLKAPIAPVDLRRSTCPLDPFEPLEFALSSSARTSRARLSRRLPAPQHACRGDFRSAIRCRTYEGSSGPRIASIAAFVRSVEDGIRCV